MLKDLQSRCNLTEFNQLMFCLSSPSIKDHIEYKNWTPLSGRLKCFQKLREYLEMIYPISKEENRVVPGRFKRIIKNVLTSNWNEYYNTIKNNFSLLDEKLFEDVTEVQMNIEEDIKPRSKVPKDTDDLRKSNQAIKAIRNEKISQSLKVNKISEIEDEEEGREEEREEEEREEDNKKFNYNQVGRYQNNNNFTNNYNKNELYEIPEEGRHKSSPVLNDEDEPNELEEDNFNNTGEDIGNINQEINYEEESFSHQNLEEDHNNIDYITKLNKYKLEEEEEINYDNQYNNNQSNNNPNHYPNYDNNALSDLDKEEYYMKSTYDYFDYDITTLTERKVITDSHPIRTSCFSTKGDYFAIGTNSKSIKLFEMNPLLQKFNKKNSYNFKNNIIENYEDIKLVFEQKNHHLGSIYCLDWSISGRLLASGSNDKLVKLMVIPDLDESYLAKDQETLELSIPGHRGTIRSVSFEPTSDLVLLSAGTVDHCIKVWDAEKGSNITNLEGHTNDIHTIKWSNDALLCGSSGVDKTIRFWDLRDYKSTLLISALKYSDINDISIHTRNRNYLSTLVAAGHVDGSITVWDYNKRCIIKEIAEHFEEVRSVSFSPDGKYLASASFDSKIKIFDVDNNFDLIGELEHLDRVVSVKWHPEVPLLISTSADKTARIWIPDV